MRKTATTVEDLLFTKAFQTLLVLRDGSVPIRVISQRIGVTERYLNNILLEFEAAGLVKRTRVGRGNTYALNLSKRLFDGKTSVNQMLRAASALERKPATTEAPA